MHALDPETRLCHLRGYSGRIFVTRPHRRYHGRARRAAARDGVRHLLRPAAAGGHLLRHRHRISDLGPRRLPLPDRRADGRVRGRRERGIVAQHGVEGLFMCTMMAGALLVAAGRHGPRHRACASSRGRSSSASPTASRCSSRARRSRTSSALQIASVPGEFLARMRHPGGARRHVLTDGHRAGRRIAAVDASGRRGCARRVPPTLVALLGGTVVAVASGLPVETIGSALRRHPERAAQHPRARVPARPDPSA